MKSIGIKINVYGRPEEFFTDDLIPGYAISKRGTLIETATERNIAPVLNSSGYASFSLNLPTGWKWFQRHRLVALIFIPDDRDKSGLYVNHIDGDKTNDWYENLEWVTPQENVEHAGAMGLTSKCMPIQVRDVISGEVEEYPSLIACGRATGLDKDQMRFRALSDGQRTYPELKQYRPKSSSSEWAVYDPSAPVMHGHVFPIQMRDLNSGEIKTFDKQRDLAAYLGKGEAYVSKWSNDPRQPVLEGLIQIKPLNGTPWIDHDDPYISVEESTGNRLIMVTDVDRAVSTIYFSARECAAAHNLLPTTLNWRLKKSSKRVVYPDGCIYQYYRESSPLRVTEE